MSKYHEFMREFNREKGYNSFYGSNKKDFLDAWERSKTASVKPRPSVAPQTEPIKKGEAAFKVLTNPDLLKKIGSFTKGRPKEEILADIWDVLHKYYVAYENLNFYDWIGPNDENGRFGKSKKGRNLSKTYMEEIRKWTDILEDLVEKGVIEQYEELSGEDYSTVDDPVKPKVLPTKEEILVRTNKWGSQLEKLIAKLE